MGDPTIRIARVYDLDQSAPGQWFLVDRLWPRGVKKDALKLARWLREVAPSDELRRWFGHDPKRWEEFRNRYVTELDEKPEAWEPLVTAAQVGDVVLLYGARDLEHNNAIVLRDYLTEKLEDHPPDESDEGGESACLLPWVCPECGRVTEDRARETCSNCGARLPSAR